jgi:hypothetical protein
MAAGKTATWDYLVEKGKQNPGFTYTGVSTGLFFDWVCDVVRPFSQVGKKYAQSRWANSRQGLRLNNAGLDFDKKTAMVVDSGNERFYTSNLPFIGRAVAQILGPAYDATANKYICIASFNTSANEIRATVEKLTGQKFTVHRVDSKELQQQGVEKLEQGDFFNAFVSLLGAWTSADGAGHALKKEDSANELLGLKEESLEESIKEWLMETKRL